MTVCAAKLPLTLTGERTVASSCNSNCQEIAAPMTGLKSNRTARRPASEAKSRTCHAGTQQTFVEILRPEGTNGTPDRNPHLLLWLSTLNRRPGQWPKGTAVWWPARAVHQDVSTAFSGIADRS